jgi:DNA-binding Lrp family transcriptional regulator
MRAVSENDIRILTELSNNARITNKALAARVGISQSSCLERVRRLEQQGVLLGSHADVAPEAVGVNVQALVGVQLKRHTRSAVASFRAYATTLPEVSAVYHVSGEYDFFIHVATRDVDHLRDFALDSLTTRPEVQSIQTSIVFDAIRRPGWPALRTDDP